MRKAMVAAAMLALAAAAQGGQLVTEMMAARGMLRKPPRAMKMAEAPAEAQWDFKPERVEMLLRRQLERNGDGRWVRKGRGGEAGEDAAALAWVNMVISEWAIMAMDAKHGRCDAGTVLALAAYQRERTPDYWKDHEILDRKGMLKRSDAHWKKWSAAWKVGENTYLVHTADAESECRANLFQFVMWDGKHDWPVAGFNTFPDAERFTAVMNVLKNPKHQNNLMAYMHRGEANLADYSSDYVESMLRRAAAGGCEEAFWNLGALAEERGDEETAKSFFSRCLR